MTTNEPSPYPSSTGSTAFISSKKIYADDDRIHLQEWRNFDVEGRMRKLNAEKDDAHNRDFNSVSYEIWKKLKNVLMAK